MVRLLFCRTRIILHKPLVTVLYSERIQLKNYALKWKFGNNYSTDNSSKSGWLAWKGIFKQFIPIGLCLIAVMQWRAYRKRIGERAARPWEINCYCMLPLRTISRCWGWIADKNLPEWSRPYVYGLYIKTFNVNMSEAADEQLKSYSSLGEFFTRPLKNGVRTIDESSCLVSPCDGTVLHFGTAKNGCVEQVKGVTYSLDNFFGENSWQKNINKNKDNQTKSTSNKTENCKNLYQCVIYLAPGDCHRFNSPAEWVPIQRKHFAGQLLSVNPSIAKWVPGLFCLNERVVYLGQWQHGFFSFTAVGATNVGSVKVYFDKSLQTNQYKSKCKCNDKFLGSNISLRKGDPLGEFRMGSTIVLIFEAPSNFNFSIHPGQKIQIGQSIGCFATTKFTDSIGSYEKQKLSIS